VITIKCKLIVKEKDFLDYQTLVFKSLEEGNIPFGKHYIMCVRFPNWHHRDIDEGEIGFLTYNEVIAGKDGWYDSESGNIIPYNYSNLIFIKFVREVDSSKKDIII
jgi:hypothetical protein